MLKVAYISTPDEQAAPSPEAKPKNDFSRRMTYAFYKKACKQKAERIKKIQEHFPGWMPEPSYNLSE